jgi:hypothetical protein
VPITVRQIDTSEAVLSDPLPHALLSGMHVTPGKVVIEKVKTTNTDFPMAATMISDDESQVIPAAAESPGGGVWKFTWADLPELGCDAVLRLEELITIPAGDHTPLGFAGAVVTLTVHVLKEFTEETCP